MQVNLMNSESLKCAPQLPASSFSLNDFLLSIARHINGKLLELNASYEISSVDVNSVLGYSHWQRQVSVLLYCLALSITANFQVVCHNGVKDAQKIAAAEEVLNEHMHDFTARVYTYISAMKINNSFLSKEYSEVLFSALQQVNEMSPHLLDLLKLDADKQKQVFDFIETLKKET
jgi:hypothetical protein